MKHKSYLFFTNNEELKRGKALLSREDIRLLFKKSGSSDAERDLFFRKISGNPLLEPPSYLCEEKVNERLSWKRRNAEMMSKLQCRLQ